ncbi:MAG: 4-alpha-glucanotransferase, partial [Deltaproteobacteria bacterium]|nr:4-alpha-glucanotransferase [Deltaproteobacteria bacterium]
MTYFIFCVHNHQPAGNFGYVLEHAYSKAYEPLLKKLYEKPSFKFCFHTSGFLLDWLSEWRPGYIELLKAMVKRGQV